MAKWEPRYSGPNRSGVCQCGHKWDEHHLGCVMNAQYFEETGECYVPEECLKYGFNETGGMMIKKGKWVDHCHGYKDEKEST